VTAGRLTYWSSGGEIVATHGRLIALEDAERLRILYRGEAEAAAATHDHCACAAALRLAMELRQALGASGRWRLAARAAYGAETAPLGAPSPA
jgi:hypothetical protein